MVICSPRHDRAPESDELMHRSSVRRTRTLEALLSQIDAIINRGAGAIEGRAERIWHKPNAGNS